MVGPASLLSPDRLARIAIDSLSPSERHAAGLRTNSQPELPKIKSRLKEWRNAACEGNEARFLERLALDGLDATAAASLLGRINVPSNFQLPEWCNILNAVLETTPRLRDAAVSSDAARHFLYLRPPDPLPFEELLLPFVDVAHALLAEGGASNLPTAVLNTFARDLLRRLTEIAARVLVVEFRAFLAYEQFAENTNAGVETAITSRAQYCRFVAKIYEEGWGPVFEEYSVVARLYGGRGGAMGR